MAAAIKTLGAGATMSELFLTIPVAGGSAALATAVGEICLVVGAVAAAFYVGACIGSLINALLDTYGIPALVITLPAQWQKFSVPVARSVAELMRRREA
jgi:hypothetical protein